MTTVSSRHPGSSLPPTTTSSVTAPPRTAPTMPEPPPPPMAPVVERTSGSVVAPLGTAVTTRGLPPGLALRVATQTGGSDPVARTSVERARTAVAARIAEGSFPSPLGEPRGGLVALGGTLVQRFTGGSSYPCGSALVLGTDGKAHQIVNGFWETWQQPRAELDGRPLAEALGAPQHPERWEGSVVVQRFAHGALYWTPEKGVWLEPPDLPALRKASLPPPPPRTDVPLGEARARLIDHFAEVRTALAGKVDLAGLELVALDRTRPLKLREACASLVADASFRAAVGSAPITDDMLLQHAARAVMTHLPYTGEEHSHYFLHWAHKQLAHQPHAAATHQVLAEVLVRADRPTTVGGLHDEALRAARASVASDPSIPAALKEHAANFSALVALSAYALKNDHSEQIKGFPVFMWDGRSNDAGFDKAWHFTNHAMMAYVMRLDAQFGDGTVTADFTRAVADSDKAGTAQRVGRTYDERRGRLGAMVGQALDGPGDEDAPLYAPRPTDLSAREGTIYDTVVRLGDVHEYKASGGDTFDVTLDDIGDVSRRFDPLAELSTRFARVWGLQDLGVSRDLTANRLGAAYGLQLFRNPTVRPTIPHDVGKTAATAPYARDHAIPFDRYVADERLMLGILKGTAQPSEWSALRAEAQGLGRAESEARLLQEMGQLVDTLMAGDPDKLARFYGNFAVRHLRFGERLPTWGKDQDAPDSKGHSDWARWCMQSGNAAALKDGFLRRIREALATA